MANSGRGNEVNPVPGMTYAPMAVPGAWVFTPKLRADDRGRFLEAFTADSLREATGRDLDLAQVNTSVSRAGVLRGIHFSDVPPGQAKYVQCVHGAVVDVVVDVREGSPTFGAADWALLDDRSRRSVFVPEGLGHGFLALSDDAAVTYLCSTAYAPGREHGVDPFSVGVDWQALAREAAGERAGSVVGKEPILSDKDRGAPTLAEARTQGMLPGYDAAVEQAGSRGSRA